MTPNFVSIPRCASHSIHTALNDFSNNHRSIRKTRDHRFSFAVIRDPLKRLISWWRHMQKPSYAAFKEIYDKPFADWVDQGCQHHWDDEFLQDTGVTNPLIQSDFVTDESGTVIVSHLVRFESIRGWVDLGLYGRLRIRRSNGSDLIQHAIYSTAAVVPLDKPGF